MKIMQMIKISKEVVMRSALVLAALALIPSAAHAATISKADNPDNLNLTSSWTGSVVPGAADIAQWTNTVAAGNTTASLGADLSWAGIKIVGPGGAVTINSGNTLTVGTSGIDLSTATTNLTLNCGLTLLGKQSWKAAAGRTLTVGGTFTHTGTMVDFTSFNAAAILNGLANDASGILGPWATTGSGTSMNYVTNNAGAISAYTGQTPSANADLSDVNNAGVNYSFATAGAGTATQTVAITANTLLYTGTGTQSAGAIANNGKTITVNGLLGNCGTARFLITGTGNLMIGANKELVCNYNTGFSGITCPIVDYNDGSPHASSVTINVNPSVGTEFGGWGNSGNTYSGGTTINSVSGSAFQFNITATSAALGTGPITFNGNNITFRPTGTTFANNITINKNSSVIVRNNSGTTVFNGNITLNSSITFANAGANQSETVNGNVTGTGGISVSHPAALTDIVLLTGTNTYTGPTAVNNGLLKAGRASVANVSGAFGLNSAVTMANSATARIDLNGYDTQIGSLTGGGATGGNVTNSSALTAVTLTVGGDNTRPATFAGCILGPRLSLRKIGSGTLTLSGANTYSNTTVSAGTLSVSNSVFADNADVRIYTNSTLSLNHSDTDTIRSLYIDGAGQSNGVWGAVGSGATNESARITGSGKLNVGTSAWGNTKDTYSISGRVTTNGVGLAGVTVSDGTRTSKLTGTDGTYTISGVPDGGIYTVTPINYRYSFEQPSLPVTVSGGDIVGQNFTATLLPPKGTLILIF
ncbi:MAG: autotransporter-associated beta strand repeat-containing protein [bacterium]